MTHQIVLSENPRGRFQEGILKNASVKPGTALKVIDTEVSGDYSDPYLTGGAVRRQHVEAGMAGEILITTQPGLMAGSVDAALPVDSQVHYYIPLPGDEFKARAKAAEVLDAGVRATFDADGLLVASATGILVVQEDAGTVAADAMVLVRMGVTASATV